MDTSLKRLLLELARRAASEKNATKRLAITQAYWELRYLYEFGLFPPDADASDIQLPERTWPDPSPETSIGILFDMLDALSGNPNPEPAISSVLKNKAARLAAAKAVAKRMRAAHAVVSAEVARVAR